MQFSAIKQKCIGFTSCICICAQAYHELSTVKKKGDGGKCPLVVVLVKIPKNPHLTVNNRKHKHSIITQNQIIALS